MSGNQSKKPKEMVSQSLSQPTSPVAQSRSSLDTLPVVVGGSNPEVTVRVMEAEIAALEQLSDRVDTLVAKRMDQPQKHAESFFVMDSRGT